MNVFMIMCHKNADQVLRLAKRVKTQNSDVVIHADSEMPNEEYKRLLTFCDIQSGIYLTCNRIHGELDTRSLVDIVIEMIKTAKDISKKNKVNYKYYVLLSGQDYLIKPIKEVERELEKIYPKPIIDCTPYNDNNWVKYKFNCNKKTNDFRRKVDSLKKGVFRYIARIIDLSYRKITIIAGKTSYVALNKMGIELYGGSAWWILPDITVDFILNELGSEKKYINVLLNSTFTPEETFFQIMTMRSPVRDLVSINSPDMVAQNCKTWAYFSDDTKPFKGHPYIFTSNECEKLIQSKCWFARKFDIRVDAEIFDLIDEWCGVEKNHEYDGV